MKLRNKKTGKIGDLIGTERSCPYITIGVDFHDGNPRAFDYTSLAGLNEEWEDYKPVEPLIKDEKVRKAVRAWAEADEVTRVRVYAIGGGEYSELYAQDKGVTDSRIRMSIKTQYSIDWGDEYTIEELCGEEEE